MACIKVIAPQRWRVRIRTLDPGTGQWKTVSRNVRGSKKEATRIARELETLKDRGLLRAGRGATVAEYAELWLAGVQPSLAYQTYRGYSVNVRRHIVPSLGSVKLRDLGTAHVNASLAHLLEKGLSPRTVQYVRAVLRMALEQALDDGLVVRNVAARTKPPKVERREMLVLDEGQVRTLIDGVSETPLLAPVILAVLCGLRHGMGAR